MHTGQVGGGEPGMALGGQAASSSLVLILKVPSHVTQQVHS